MLVSVVDDERSARNVDGGSISVNEKVTASVVADKNLIAMADNDDNYKDSRPKVGDDELKEIPPNEKDVHTKPSDEEFTGLVSLPSKAKKKKKKKKASKLKGKGSALNNTKGEEVEKEGHSSFEGIFLPQLLLISPSDWLIYRCRVQTVLRTSMCHVMPFSARARPRVVKKTTEFL